MRYTKTHEWVKLEGNRATVGITDLAQKELGEIVFVELPTVGASVKAGDEGVVVESTKAAVDLYYPLSGEISKVNLSLKENPELINSSAQSEGWLYQVTISDKSEFESLLSEEQYSKDLPSS
ncbi:MAG: Glycine cleavage system H protein [Chlamydiales bacterium]|nr:Glycine cleavage system H protein [Chlamydiales bacterium]MCH9635499.1 Glycine cleavage system H protein [Chlamydiales bacterium]MCH9703658.1 glycine cleavage system protein GcvH [Chlamydiota bacterium]